jgi:integrase
MSRREKHQTKTKSGTLAHIRINGQLHRQHFNRETDPLTIKKWLLKTELKYRRTTSTQRGRFDADALAYLETVKAMPTFEQRKQHIEEWIAVFKDTPRDRITAADIQHQLNAWRTETRQVKQRAKAGQTRTKSVTLSAASVNKRRTALMHLFTVLDGKSEPNPVRDVPKFTPPSEQPRGLSYDLIRAIFAAMPASKSKARLMVMAYVGLPPALIKQVEPHDVNEKLLTVAVHGRRKGRGTQGRVYPLTRDGVRAFQMMRREDAWGPFSHATLRVVFKRACKHALGRDNFTPYDLRHSFGTELYRASGDIRATQVLMGHSTPQLTHRYTLAAVDPRLLAALKTFGKKPRK